MIDLEQLFKCQTNEGYKELHLKLCNVRVKLSVHTWLESHLVECFIGLSELLSEQSGIDTVNLCYETKHFLTEKELLTLQDQCRLICDRPNRTSPDWWNFDFAAKNVLRELHVVITKIVGNIKSNRNESKRNSTVKKTTFLRKLVQICSK